MENVPDMSYLKGLCIGNCGSREYDRLNTGVRQRGADFFGSINIVNSFLINYRPN